MQEDTKGEKLRYKTKAFVSGVYVRGKQKTGHRSLLCFAYKPLKNRRLVDFLPCKLRNEPDNRGFYGFSTKKAIKTYKRDRLIGFLEPVYQEAWKSS
jgi:hypothetical protein